MEKAYPNNTAPVAITTSATVAYCARCRALSGEWVTQLHAYVSSLSNIDTHLTVNRLSVYGMYAQHQIVLELLQYQAKASVYMSIDHISSRGYTIYDKSV